MPGHGRRVMSEAEILNQVSLNQGQAFMLMQWWFSVTVGLVAIAHFFSKKLNLFLLILIVAAYVAYTTYINRFLLLLFQQNSAFILDLEALQSSGSITEASDVLVESMRDSNSIFSAGSSFIFASVVTFVASLSYLIYRYIQYRRIALGRRVESDSGRGAV